MIYVVGIGPRRDDMTIRAFKVLQTQMWLLAMVAI